MSEAVTVELKELVGKAMEAAWQDEIERAVENVKRTRLDRWYRQAWYRAEGRKGRRRSRRHRRRGPETDRRARG